MIARTAYLPATGCLQVSEFAPHRGRRHLSRWQRDCFEYDESLTQSIPWRAGMRRFRIPDRLTDSVPTFTLLLQTGGGSINSWLKGLVSNLSRRLPFCYVL